MQFNQYTAYTIVSTVEKKNKHEFQKILNLLKELDAIETLDDAKEYLKRQYCIKDSIREFPLGANAFLHVIENDMKLSIRVNYKIEEDECVIYSYKK